jgi:hypothetical protein
MNLRNTTSAPIHNFLSLHNNLHRARIPTQPPHILRLARRHPHQALEVGHVCCELRELGLQVGELAGLLRGDGAEARRGLGARKVGHRVFGCVVGRISVVVLFGSKVK